MPVVEAFLVPGSPLPWFDPDNEPWKPIVDGFAAVRARIEEINPDVLIVYSTSWFAVMDQLWQTMPHVKGRHVDENWFELGELDYDFTIDTALAGACIARATADGPKSKGVNYDGFPIDTGTIVAMNFLNPEGRIPVVITSNNLYHDAQTTADLGHFAADEADKQGKRAVVIAIGGLSGDYYREDIDVAQDSVTGDGNDGWNRKMLDYLSAGDMSGFAENLPAYAEEAKVDMGFKHYHFIAGALGGTPKAARVLGYGPLYGAGGAVIAFSS